MSARRLVLAGVVSLCAMTGGMVFSVVSVLAASRYELSSSFGSFATPAGVGVDGHSGNVYVADAESLAVGRFTASGAAGSPAQLTGKAFGQPAGVAVDNSGGITEGDVYVADLTGGVLDKFNAAGDYVSQITGLSSPAGVAVDSAGEVYVAELESGQVQKFNVLGEPSPANPIVTGLSAPRGLAVDSEGNIYAATATGTVELNAAGQCVLEGCAALDGTGQASVAVDSANDVFADEGAAVALYSSAGALLERFGSGTLSSGAAIGVDATGVYVADSATKVADLFIQATVPDVTTAAALAQGAGEKLTGVVNPDSINVDSCQFEYGTNIAYGQSVPCSELPGAGGAPVEVTANIAGLQPGTLYHYRLVATNANGTNESLDGTFTSPSVAPTVESEGVANVASTSATFEGQINPGGADTTYRFEYGTDASYGASLPVPEGSIAAGASGIAVTAHLQGLQPGTVYHYRLVATNSIAPAEGVDETFTTQPGGSPFQLPDGRQYELVSPADKDGTEVYQSFGGGGASQASEDGTKVTYITGEPPVLNAPGNALGTQVLSERHTDGWSSADIATPHDAPSGVSVDEGVEYKAFSSDLSLGLVAPLGTTPLGGEPPTAWSTPYLRDNTSGAFQPLLTEGDILNDPKVRGGGIDGKLIAEFEAASPDFAHVVFISQAALTFNAIPTGASPESFAEGNLYEYGGGGLQLVNVLPDGQPTVGEAVLGSSKYSARGAVSDDGSHIVWSYDEALYLRDMESGETVQIDASQGVSKSGKGELAIANSDGSRIFFKDNENHRLVPGASSVGSDLYVYEDHLVAGKLTGTLTDLTESTSLEGADVKSVLGINEDGSDVYFVAEGVLAPGDKGGDTSLYETHKEGSAWSKPKLIARNIGGFEEQSLAYLTARVSPNGRYVTFVSGENLTSYDSHDVAEIYLYDGMSGKLVCASCNSTGARPTGSSRLPAWDEYSLNRYVYQPRYLSNEGRVFFDSTEALVPQDVNGLEDVYEYEPAGVGTTCDTEPGCLSLISGGAGSEASSFVDASVSGDDVFFITKDQLVAQDFDHLHDLYDAHVCASAEPCAAPAAAASPPCNSGDGCKAAPTPQPAVFGAPASATFSGAGNVMPTGPTAVAVKAKGKAKGSRSRRKAARGKSKKRTKQRKRRRARKSGLHESLSRRTTRSAGR